ncbi:hypothetical protein INR49_000675 [Caranx melampygus]|nr:hypothetical protein INR49_000675 [Caranx melampygus]
MCDGSDGNMAAAMVQMSCLYRGMLAVRATGIRPLIPGLVSAQFRAFSVRKEPELEENPFYSKYQDKIQKLRREKMAASDGASGGFTKNKTLGSILNMDMIQDKTGEEVAELWMKYYSTKDTISAVIPTQIYETIISRSESCPMFLYALPQREGYEFFVGQWSGHELHFTSLINVQTMGENAPSQLILYHYPELRQEKGIVLMTAEMDPKFITVHQAQCLANQVQLFYGTQRQETYRLVETFNHQPADFKHMLVIAELEQSGLGSAAPSTGS